MSKGVYTNEELLDSIIVDCNESVKSIVSGQYLQFCNLMSTIAMKLNSVKNGIIADMARKNETIEALKEQLKNSGSEVQEIPVEQLMKDAQEGSE